MHLCQMTQTLVSVRLPVISEEDIHAVPDTVRTGLCFAPCLAITKMFDHYKDGQLCNKYILCCKALSLRFILYEAETYL